MHFVSTLITQYQPSSLLDVGCGDGRLLEFISRKDKKWKDSYIGIDLCREAISLAKVLNQHDSFFCNDIADISGQFEVITLIEVLEHIPSDSIVSFLNSIKVRLSQEGKLFVTVPSVNIPLNKKHYRHYTLELLTDTLESAGFMVSNAYFLYRISWLTRMACRSIRNKYFSLNPSTLTKYIWQFHEKFCYMANENNCQHIVVEARYV